MSQRMCPSDSLLSLYKSTYSHLKRTARKSSLAKKADDSFHFVLVLSRESGSNMGCGYCSTCPLKCYLVFLCWLRSHFYLGPALHILVPAKHCFGRLDPHSQPCKAFHWQGGCSSSLGDLVIFDLLPVWSANQIHLEDVSVQNFLDPGSVMALWIKLELARNPSHL